MMQKLEEQCISYLEDHGFVYLSGGRVRLGTISPLPCRLEGYRRNETPERTVIVPGFWICKFCVTNEEYERFDKRFERPVTSLDDRHPVVNVTYMNAISYAKWLSKNNEVGLEFSLPTEAQWVFAAAPFSLEFPWGNEPNEDMAHTHRRGISGPLRVDDPTFGTNWCNLYHMGGNVQEFVLGTNYAQGTNGAEVDGMYCIVKGGDWSHCKQSAGVARRGLIDVAGRAPTVGFRLVANYQCY